MPPRKASKAPARRKAAKPKGKPSAPATRRASAKPATKGPGPVSTFSPRLEALRAELDRELTSRFPNAERRFEWNMHGWRVPRHRHIATWTGTIDPNFLYVFLAERKRCISLHLWDPLQFDILARNQPALRAAGFKVMRGCVNYERKGGFPLAPIRAILDQVRGQFDAERRG